MYRHVQTACDRNGNAPVCGEKMLSITNDAHIMYYQKRQCTDMYKTACGRNGNAPVCGGKCFLMMPISSITKKGNVLQTCTNSLCVGYVDSSFYGKKAMYRHVQTACGRNGNAPVCGGKCFLMMPISSITKKGNVLQTCTNSLWQEWECTSMWGKMLSNDTHIIYYKKGSAQTCINSLWQEWECTSKWGKNAFYN
jgi:hypothetical protein